MHPAILRFLLDYQADGRAVKTIYSNEISNIARYNYSGLTNKTKKRLGIALKVTILAVVAWVLYQKLNNHQNLKAFERLMQNLGTETVVVTLSVVVALMFVNWFLEGHYEQLDF